MKKKLTIFTFVFIFGVVGFFIWAENFYSSQPLPGINYAPNFWFDSEEIYFPADPLKFYYENGEEISGEKAVEKYNSLSTEEKLKNINVFYNIQETKNEWVYQYWLFYVFNDYDNEHYGDWESVFVFVDKNTVKINKAVGSAHGTLNNELNLADINIENTWVYIGSGSHANCPDKIPDGECDFFWWSRMEGKYWTDEDIENGQRISYDNYILQEIDEEFIKNFQNQPSFNKEKSPDLGVNLFKALPFEKIGIPKPQKDIYLPFPGTKETPDFAWNQPQYNNPELIRPLPKLVLEKTKNFFEKATNLVQNAFNDAITIIQSTINQINPFQASLVTEVEPAAFTETPSISSPPLPPASPATGTPLPAAPQTRSVTLAEIQEQIDDITEKIDILQQEVAKLVAANTITPQVKGVTTETPFIGGPLPDEDEESSFAEASEDKEPQILIVKNQEQKPTNPQPTQQTTKPTNQGYSASTSPPAKILITEIQTKGDNTAYDFIELYNSNNHEVELKDYRLVKRAKTSSSDTTIKSWSRDPDTKIPAYRYFLWASSKENYNTLINADVFTSQTISDNNGVAIRYGEEDTGQIIDAVGWGDFNNQLFEGSAFPTNPSQNQSLERKKDGNIFTDTDNNSQDFKINQNPSPTNSANLTTLYDTTLPETTLDQSSLPTDPTFSTTANFVFTSNETNSTFECSLDNSDFESCISPKNYSGLSVCTHSFQVRATDPASNTDSTPASFSWEIEQLLNLLITEVQIDGNKTSYDFVEIYNPNSVDVYLEDYKLVKRTQGGSQDTSIKSWSQEPSTKILANNYFLWASSKEDDNFPLSVNADSKTTQYLADNNGIAIIKTSGGTNVTIDAVGWGSFSNGLFETAAFSQNPTKNQSIERKKDGSGNYIDTNDNSQDFFLQTNPNPKDQLLDLTAPTCQTTVSNSDWPNLTFTVNWQSPDADVSFYDTQVKIGLGDWQDWLTNTTQTQAEYVAAGIDNYSFRARATDKLYNQGSWSNEATPAPPPPPAPDGFL